MGRKKLGLCWVPERGTHGTYSPPSPPSTLTNPHIHQARSFEAVLIVEFPDRFVDPRVRKICSQFPDGTQYLAKFIECSKAHFQGSLSGDNQEGCGSRCYKIQTQRSLVVVIKKHMLSTWTNCYGPNRTRSSADAKVEDDSRIFPILNALALCCLPVTPIKRQGARNPELTKIIYVDRN